MGQQILVRMEQKWLATLFFIVFSHARCVTDPNHQLPPKPLGPSTAPALVKQSFGTAGTSFDALFIGPKMILRPSSRPKDLNPDRPCLLFIGTPLKDGMVFLDHLARDMERTGEETYRFVTTTDPTIDGGNTAPITLGGTLTGELWRGDPAKGGTLIIKALGVSEVKLHETATKRPIPEHLREKVYSLVSTDRDMVAIPLFGDEKSEVRSIRVRLRELRADPTVRGWLLKEPHLVVFENSAAIAADEADEGSFLKGKIRIRGKFYASTFERVPPP